MGLACDVSLRLLQVAQDFLDALPGLFGCCSSSEAVAELPRSVIKIGVVPWQLLNTPVPENDVIAFVMGGRPAGVDVRGLSMATMHDAPHSLAHILPGLPAGPCPALVPCGDDLSPPVKRPALPPWPPFPAPVEPGPDFCLTPPSTAAPARTDGQQHAWAPARTPHGAIDTNTFTSPPCWASAIHRNEKNPFCP